MRNNTTYVKNEVRRHIDQTNPVPVNQKYLRRPLCHVSYIMYIENSPLYIHLCSSIYIVLFSLVDNPLSPPPPSLSGSCPLKKRTFFAASLTNIKYLRSPLYHVSIREAAKKVIFLVDSPLRPLAIDETANR